MQHPGRATEHLPNRRWHNLWELSGAFIMDHFDGTFCAFNLITKCLKIIKKQSSRKFLLKGLPSLPSGDWRKMNKFKFSYVIVNIFLIFWVVRGILWMKLGILDFQVRTNRPPGGAGWNERFWPNRWARDSALLTSSQVCCSCCCWSLDPFLSSKVIQQSICFYKRQKNWVCGLSFQCI